MVPSALEGNGSEDEGPESVEFVQSRKTARRQDDAAQKFLAAEKEKKKARNRARDKQLKERAANARKIIEEEESDETDGEDIDLRMVKAMREAAEEDGHSGEDKGEADEEEDEDDSIDLGMPIDGLDDDEDEEMSDDGHDGSDPDAVASHERNSKYLPDHLFTSAFTSSSSKTKPEQKELATKKDTREKRRKKNKTAKDLIIGSRVIRTLSADTRPELRAAARTKPTRKVNAFIDRSLGLKGSVKSKKAKGWERRPANIGVLKTNGPAYRFVRGS